MHLSEIWEKLNEPMKRLRTKPQYEGTLTRAEIVAVVREICKVEHEFTDEQIVAIAKATAGDLRGQGTNRDLVGHVKSNLENLAFQWSVGRQRRKDLDDLVEEVDSGRKGDPDIATE